jgi:hypothetical protein
LCFKKKQGNSDDDNRVPEEDPIGIEQCTIAGIDRGLNYEAIRRMELGHLVDYCNEWDKIHNVGQTADGGQTQTPTRRKATQADWDAFFG